MCSHSSWCNFFGCHQIYVCTRSRAVNGSGRRVSSSGKGPLMGNPPYLVSILRKANVLLSLFLQFPCRFFKSTMSHVEFNKQFRPPLKIILFPVHRPGELINGEWVFFFHIFEIFLFFPNIFHIISIQRKKYI